MKIVVTGSQGFIGGYIVSELLNLGHEVVGVDNYSKYGFVERAHDKQPNFTLVNEDLAITNTALTEVLRDADHLIAGAAKIGGISYFHTYAYDLLAANERIIANTCDAAIKSIGKNLKKVTYLSSSMVFENTKTWPSKEGDQLKSSPPTSSYGFQKLAVEYYARAAYDQYNLPYTILRIFNAVGIGESRAANSKAIFSGDIELAMSHVLPDLIQKIIKGQDPVRLLGDGKQIRHFTYGGDLAKGIALSLENSKAFNEDFNISTRDATTILQLAEMIWKRIKGSSENFRYVCEEGFKYDVQKRIPDVTKAYELLGFRAETKIEIVLDEVIPWVRDAIHKGII